MIPKELILLNTRCHVKRKETIDESHPLGCRIETFPFVLKGMIKPKVFFFFSFFFYIFSCLKERARKLRESLKKSHQVWL